MKLIGHHKQWQFLKRSAEFNKLSHAYLFYGQEKLGKRTVALEFIKLLNCQDPDFQKRPCQACRPCKDIEKNVFPDFKFITQKEKEIHIAQIRSLESYLSLRPYSAEFKAVIIDNAHLMNQEAQNCFLKTLEEPKGKTIIILISGNPEIFLPTILSRVQKIKFSPVKKDKIEDYLKNNKVGKADIQQISELCLGSPGRAIDFARFPQKLNFLNQKIADLIKLKNSDLFFRFQYAKESSQEITELKKDLDIWLQHFRDIFLFKLKVKNSLRMEAEWKDYSLAEAKKIINSLLKIQFLISTTNVNPKLALEILVMDF